MFALLAFGLGLDRFKAAFRIAKALNASGRKSEAKDVAAWYCRSCGLDSADSKLTAFQSEFEVTDTYIKSPSEINAAAWVQADTLEALVDASSSLKQESSKETPWLTIKKQGNDSFGQKDYSSAKDYYISALCSCPFAEDLLRDSSFIVSNKGAAWLGIVAEAKHTGASFNSKPDNIIAEGTISMLSAALMNFYNNGRAWLRVSRFLEKQGRNDAATNFLESAVCLIEKEHFKLPFFNYNEDQTARALNFVVSELSELQARSESSKKVAHVNPVSTEEQLRQRTAESPNSNAGYLSEKELDEDIFQSEQGYNMHQMMDMMLDNSQMNKLSQIAGLTKDRKLVDYSAEFVRARGIPEGLDHSYARKVLYRSYVNDKLHPWMRAMGWRMAWSEDSPNNDIKRSLMNGGDMVKRWNGTAALSIISEQPEKYTQTGSIIDVRQMKPKSRSSYDVRIRSNFVNSPNRKDTFYEGTTHLAIGFNDLSSLLNCGWVAGEDQKQCPAHFVGFEMNPFNVAKSLVIAEMLGNSNVSLVCVLQAWYSTVWSSDTLIALKECAKAALTKGEDNLAPHRDNDETCWHKMGNYSAKNVSHPKVASYLNHWLSAEPVSFKEARRLWLNNTVQQNIKLFHGISSCKRRKDRLAITNYFLTGEVFGDSNFEATSLNAVGSLPFWRCPGGSPPLEEDTMFNTFLLEDLMSSLLEDKGRNFVQAFEAHALLKLDNIRSRLLNKKLTIEVYVGVVMPLTNKDGHDLVHFVAERVKPRTIGWSNVIDYMELGDLHDLGRAMSPNGNVMHYGYSMNWCTEVFGANILDYQMINNYKAANVLLDLALGENYGGNNGSATNLLSQYGALIGANEVFLYPDYDTPMNSTSYVAARMTRKYWIDNFHARAGSNVRVGSNMRAGDSMRTSSLFQYTPNNCGSRMSQELTMMAACPLHRQSTQTYLSWTYDPHLKMEKTAAPDSVFDAINTKKLKALFKK